MFANKHQFDVPPFKAAFGISSSNALVLPGMEPPDEDFMEHRTMTEGTRVQIKQVWKRKEDGLFVRVAGLIFSEPKRVMWQALPNQDNPSADGLITETEFKEQYEYQPQKRAGKLERLSIQQRLHSFRGGTNMKVEQRFAQLRRPLSTSKLVAVTPPLAGVVLDEVGCI